MWFSKILWGPGTLPTVTNGCAVLCFFPAASLLFPRSRPLLTTLVSIQIGRFAKTGTLPVSWLGLVFCQIVQLKEAVIKLSNCFLQWICHFEKKDTNYTLKTSFLTSRKLWFSRSSWAPTLRIFKICFPNPKPRLFVWDSGPGSSVLRTSVLLYSENMEVNRVNLILPPVSPTPNSHPGGTSSS